MVTICISYFRTGSLPKEQRTNKLPPTRRIRKRSKGDAMCPTASQNPSCWHPSWLSYACVTAGPWVRMIGQRQPRSESHHHNIRSWESCGRAVLLGSLTLLLSTWVTLPNKVSSFVSSCVSLDNSFRSVREEPLLGLGRSPPSCNTPALIPWPIQFTFIPQASDSRKGGMSKDLGYRQTSAPS